MKASNRITSWQRERRYQPVFLLQTLNPLRRYVVLGMAILLAMAAPAWAQRAGVHIGYVYPAGGKQGTTFEAIIAGQFISSINHVYVSGGGVQATIGEIIKPISGGELNKLRIQADEMLARKAVVRNDAKALEQFRSFKNAKSVKTDPADESKELEELKKKYANATWTPEDERQLQDIRRKMGSGVRKPANPAICEMAVVQVTIAPDAKLGQRELRIATPFALSNPLVFNIGQLPEFSEKASKKITEQKSVIAKTAIIPKNRKTEPEMAVTLPAVINGQILPSEIDRYRFTATKGQRLVIIASARALIPYLPDGVPGWFQATLGLYDAQGKELAYDDDFRFNPDPVLYYEIPADGEYVVEIKDSIYRGREDFVYRITIGEIPFITSIFPLGGPAGAKTTVKLTGWNLPDNKLTVNNSERKPGIYPLSVSKDQWTSNAVPFAVGSLPECVEKEPNNQRPIAQQVSLPIVVNGRIDRRDDVDVFSFEGRAGNEIVAAVFARRLNSPLDSVLRLTDAQGKELAMNDDHEDKGTGLNTHHADSYLRATLPADGTYYLQLADMQHQGGPEYAYRLRISEPQPDFELRAVPSSITVRGSSTVPVTVYALRRDGYTGEIAIAAKDAPAGVSVGGGLLQANEDRVQLTLTVSPLVGKEPFNLKLEGRATINGRETVRSVVPAEDMMQAFEYRHLVPSQELDVAAPSNAFSKFSLKVIAPSPLKIPVGQTASVEVSAPLTKALGRIHLDLSDAPEGITIKKVSPSREGAQIVFACDPKAKPGIKGNLIVTISSDKNAPPAKAKGKPQGLSRTPVIATLPAIPFEVVSP